MSADPFEMPVPVVRQVELPPPVIAAPQQMEHVQMALPSQEQARAVEHVFAQHKHEQNDVAGLFVLATAGMLVRDIVTDTLADPEEEEDDKEKPQPTL